MSKSKDKSLMYKDSNIDIGMMILFAISIILTLFIMGFNSYFTLIALLPTLLFYITTKNELDKYSTLRNSARNINIILGGILIVIPLINNFIGLMGLSGSDAMAGINYILIPVFVIVGSLPVYLIRYFNNNSDTKAKK